MNSIGATRCKPVYDVTGNYEEEFPVSPDDASGSLAAAQNVNKPTRYSVLRDESQNMCTQHIA